MSVPGFHHLERDCDNQGFHLDAENIGRDKVNLPCYAYTFFVNSKYTAKLYL